MWATENGHFVLGVGHKLLYEIHPWLKGLLYLAQKLVYLAPDLFGRKSFSSSSSEMKSSPSDTS
jgi:hypothetical protein